MMKYLRHPAYQGLIISILLAIIIMWVYFTRIENENYVVLDNPTADVLKVHLDENTFTLAPYQSLRIPLAEGSHTMTSYIEDSMISDEKFSHVKKIRGLLNPTRNEYVVYKRFYGKSVNGDSLIRSNQFEMDSTIYYGEMWKTDSAYISHFYLNVDQSYPKIIKSMDTVSGIPKIFRKENFKEFYREYFE